MNQMKIGFEMRTMRLALEDISPMRQIKDLHKGIMRYKKILASIKEVGLVEPLAVYPQKDAPGKYLLNTYNARVSRLPPIQEHKMIVKAVNDGVSPERLAAALNMPVHVVKASINLLNGIHEQAVELLKDKNISPRAIRLLKQVNGMRQIEIADMMVTHNNFFTGYVEALVLGTPKDQLANPDEPKKKKGMSAEDIARMESEMESLERDLKAVTDNYTENIFILQTLKPISKTY
jgi:hypothetical protein